LLSSSHSPAIEQLSQSSERHGQTPNNRSTCKSRQQHPTDFLKLWVCIHTRQPSGCVNDEDKAYVETLFGMPNLMARVGRDQYGTTTKSI
jgi:hypothetical protein